LPVLLFDQACRLLTTVLRDITDHHGGAAGGECKCGGAADPAGGTGHERDLASEFASVDPRHDQSS
jgi:hypothetical protein